MKLAEEAAHKALALDEGDPSIHCTMANLCVMQGQHDKALAAAERALSLAPGSARSQSTMGMVLGFSCRFKDAIPFYEDAIRMDPYPGGWVFRGLGSAYHAEGRLEEALRKRSAYRVAPEGGPEVRRTTLKTCEVQALLHITSPKQIRGRHSRG